MSITLEFDLASLPGAGPEGSLYIYHAPLRSRMSQLGALFSRFITAGILFEEIIILLAALVGSVEGTCTSLLKSVD
jgi:hypothetical protein